MLCWFFGRYFHESVFIKTSRFFVEEKVAGRHFTCTLLFFLVPAFFFFSVSEVTRECLCSALKWSPGGSRLRPTVTIPHLPAPVHRRPAAPRFTGLRE